MATFQSPSAPILSDNLFPVVGVGASAGGLEAFRQLLQAIPEDSPMAWILVQHLAPQHESVLPELLQKFTRLRVLEITNDVEVAAGHVYIIPSNKILTASDGILQLFDRPEGERVNTIDVFLTSLAEVHREQTIGVLLSGTGQDGTMGLKMIRDVGGFTIVQDKDSAAYYQMPQSALDADVVDMVLAPRLIPGYVSELVRVSMPISTAEKQPGNLPEQEFKQILAMLRMRKGVDFTHYKQSTIRRRILRRQALHHLRTVGEYLHFLIDKKAEQEALFRDILIPVTSFFRDMSIFTMLSETALPLLFQQKRPEEPIRIWVAGCSTGEEAYSLAICLHEFRPGGLAPGRVQIFATDLSEESIERARSGKYLKENLAGVSDSRLQQFFTRLDGHYHVQKFIREMCVFACQDFLKDPPFSRLDLVSCRNVLIYMEPMLQKRALTTFHYALNPDGYLLLGRSETCAPAADLFQPFQNASNKVFSRKDVRSSFMPVASARREVQYGKPDNALATQDGKVEDLTRATDQALLEQQGVTGVVVNQQWDIVQFRGSTGPYLEPPPGKVSQQLLRMARGGLSFELRTALHQSRTTGLPVSKSGILMDNPSRRVDIHVLPIRQAEETYYFVRFQEGQPVVQDIPTSAIASSPSADLMQAKDRAERLEKELALAKADMRAISEDQEAINEELQSANEELLSGSEELQSINEELQTTKEEVQSTNEELMILNQELISRNDQLVDARQYAEAIVKAVYDPLVILTSDLRIRNVNQSFYDFFYPGAQPVEGRLFFELDRANWDFRELRQKVLQVIPEQRSFDQLEVSSTAGGKSRYLLISARQVVSDDNENPLILLAIRDVTEERETRSKQEAVNRMFENMILQAPAIAASFLGADHRFGLVNDSFRELTGNKELEKLQIGEVLQEWSLGNLANELESVYSTGEVSMGQEVRWIRHASAANAVEEFWLNYSLQPLLDGNQEIMGVLLFGYDVTPEVEARKMAEHHQQMFARELEIQVDQRTGELKEVNEQLVRSNQHLEQFASIASHDLQEPLRKIKTFTAILNRRFSRQLPPDAQDAIEKIRGSADRMSQLINEVRDFSKLLHAREDINETNLDTVLHHVLEDLDLLIADTRAVVHYDNPLPVLSVNRVQMHQLFYNLLTNALKFYPEHGSPFVTITHRIVASGSEDGVPRNWLEIDVSDHGIGFRPEYAEQIFELFERLHSQEEFEGTGIGLALCKQIMHYHQGTITAYGEEGKGARFVVRFPLPG